MTAVCYNDDCCCNFLRLTHGSGGISCWFFPKGSKSPGHSQPFHFVRLLYPRTADTGNHPVLLFPCKHMSSALQDECMRMNRKQVVFLAGNRKSELYGLTSFIGALCEFDFSLKV